MNMTSLVNKMKTSIGANAYHSTALNAVRREQESKRAIRFVLTSALITLLAIEPSIAAATEFGNIGAVATKVLTFVTGTFGKTVATIAVVVLGMMAMFGKLEWDRALKVIFGIAIVFGAGSVINSLSSMDGTVAGGVAAAQAP